MRCTNQGSGFGQLNPAAWAANKTEIMAPAIATLIEHRPPVQRITGVYRARCGAGHAAARFATSRVRGTACSASISATTQYATNGMTPPAAAVTR